MKLLWCVTGGEYWLEESISLLEGFGGADVAFSKAGWEVAGVYSLRERIIAAGGKLYHEAEAGGSSPLTMRLKSYGMVVVAPCTANTVAKIAHGIADSLVSNIISQAIKEGVKVVVLPTDAKRTLQAKTVSGGEFKIKCRKIDLDNVKRIRGEVSVASSPTSLKKHLTAAVRRP